VEEIQKEAIPKIEHQEDLLTESEEDSHESIDLAEEIHSPRTIQIAKGVS
jgi:hypothetical protein